MAVVNLFSSLFTPSQERVERAKDIFDHIADYTDTSAGAWDLFRVGNHVFSAIDMQMAALSQAVGRTKEVFNTAGIGLSIPRFFSDVNTLRRSISQFSIAQGMVQTDSTRSTKMAQAAKKSFLDATVLTNTVAQMALFADNAKIIAWGTASLSVFNGLCCATDAICDGAELIGEYFKLTASALPVALNSTSPEHVALGERQTLSWIIIAKDVASIALATLCIAALFLGTTAANIVTPVAFLTLSAFWLTMKIASYFYNKIIVTPRAASI